MKRSVACLLLAAGLALAACGSGAKDDPILRLSAEESLAEGRRLYEAEKFSQSRPYFQHAFEVEPNSAVGREALLLVADALYQQSGGGLLIQAEAKYRDFLNRFPTSDRAPYVQLQIARTLLRRMERPDRDQESTRKAQLAFEDLLRLYPTGEFTAEAQEGLARVRTNLAEHEFAVARFYLRFGLPPAAATRLEALLEQYPDYLERDKALFHLALAYRRSGKKDAAQETMSKLRAEFPSSPWLRKVPKEMR